MRNWAADVRARLIEIHASMLSHDTVEEIAQHLADVHRAALYEGCSVAEANARVELELRKMPQLATALAARKRSAQAPVARSSAGLPGVIGDFAHAWRLLFASRGFATVVVLTLAVGIGGCAAVFSLFNALLLKPLPYPDPEQLVLLWETDASDNNAQFIVSAPNYEDWKRETRSFAALGIWEYRTYNLSAAADPEQVSGLRASSSLFDVLAVKPALGRTFTAAEDEPGHQVVVISDAVWRTHFAADPGVIGRALLLNGSTFDVIGVMPEGFEFPRKGVGVWTPIAFEEQDRHRSSHSFFVAGRLRPPVTFEQARDEVQRLGEVLRQKYEENANEGATVQRMSEYGMGNVRRILVALSGAVALVLLIAIVNVGSLQVALGFARRREFVTRLALGATHRHLAQQVLIEGLVVSALGCAAGIAGAWVATRLIDVVLSPGFRDIPMRGEVAVTLDARVVLFAVVTAFVAALLFAFAPLAGLRRPSLQPLLREGERGATRLALGTRRVLVTTEIALAIVVLSAAGLMVRSLSTLLQVRPGLDPRNVLTMRISLPQADTYGPPERVTFCADLAREVGSLPGVLNASAISHLPLSGMNAGRGFTIEGRPPVALHEGPSANYRLICPGYFATLGIPIVRGRDFTQQDGRDNEPVAIINRSTANQHWPGQDPLGQRFKIGSYESRNPWLTVIGIVEDVKHFGLEADARREIFLPYMQAAWPVMTVIAKTAAEPRLFETSIRGALRRVELNLPAANARSMEDVISLSVAWRELPMRLLSVFAIVALILAGIGVYGVLAYYVSQRTREFGVRLALGTSKRALIALVLRQSAWPLVIGAILGIAGSLASGELLGALLYEVKPGDPAVLAATVMALGGIALIASWLPARRAAAVDPIVALRDE